MRKLVVYFHGYNSGPNSSKVQKLRRALPDVEVRSFDIDIDPSISMRSLMYNIDMMLLDNLVSCTRIVFVGTSLGAWYAGTLATLYGCDAVLINPSLHPANSLKKRGVDRHICDEYSSLHLNKKHHFFVSLADEVLDFSKEHMLLSMPRTRLYKEGSHRFDGPEFQDVIDCVRGIVDD